MNNCIIKKTRKNAVIKENMRHQCRIDILNFISVARRHRETSIIINSKIFIIRKVTRLFIIIQIILYAKMMSHPLLSVCRWRAIFIEIVAAKTER